MAGEGVMDLQSGLFGRCTSTKHPVSVDAGYAQLINSSLGVDHVGKISNRRLLCHEVSEE